MLLTAFFKFLMCSFRLNYCSQSFLMAFLNIIPSTLLRLLMCIYHPYNGTLKWNGGAGVLQELEL